MGTPFEQRIDGVLLACNAAFGETVTYTPLSTAVAFTLEGVFDRAYTEIDLSNDGPPVSAQLPVLGVRLADFAGPGPQKNDTLVVRGDQFVVREVRPDGHGHAKLMLNRLGPA